MNTAKLFSLLCCLFVLTGSTLCQTKVDSIEHPTFKHSLGVAAGFTTGYGVSYRFWPGRFGLQGTFAPHYDEMDSRYNVGLTILFKAFDSEELSFFLFQGNSYYYTSSTNYLGNVFETTSFNHGLGFGGEIVLFERVGSNLMFGYASYENFKRIGFTVECGLYFKF